MDAAPDPVRLRSAVQALVRRFGIAERADVACCGVTVAQAAALEALGAEGPQRLGELSRQLGIAPSTLTRNLLRLEEEGLVAREADPDDARAARVGLTARGRRAAAAVEDREAGFARQVLERIPPGRRAAVLTALGDLLAAVRGATEDCCPGAFDHLMAGTGADASTTSEGAGETAACGCGPSATRGARR